MDREKGLLTQQQAELSKKMEEILQEHAKKITNLKASNQSSLKFVEQKLEDSKRKMIVASQKEKELVEEVETLNAANRALKKELQKVEEGVECKVCYEDRIDTVVFPCSHQALCSKCTVGMKFCPICRTQITEIIKVFPNWK